MGKINQFKVILLKERKELNIDVELEELEKFESNSEKMISELNNRRNKVLKELTENQKTLNVLLILKGRIYKI